MKKTALNIRITYDVTEEEKEAARKAISMFESFMSELKKSRDEDKRFVDILQDLSDLKPEDLFEIRHLIRRFQKDIQARYTKVVFLFSGQKDEDFKSITNGAIQSLSILSTDGKIESIKDALLDSFGQLVQFIEEFIGSLDDFEDNEQTQNIIYISKKADKIVYSLENLIDRDLKPYLEKNILRKKSLASIQQGQRRRLRFLNIFTKKEG